MKVEAQRAGRPKASVNHAPREKLPGERQDLETGECTIIASPLKLILVLVWSRKID